MHHYGTQEKPPRKIQVMLTDPQAVFPQKAHQDDSKSGIMDVGYDLYLISRENNVSGDQVGKVTVFDTGVAMCPENGAYIEIVARSSLYKRGYMLANGVGIIDPSYTGSIKVALLKFGEGKDLDLKFRAVQAIPRTIASVQLERAALLPQSARGSAGFGSSPDFYAGGQSHTPSAQHGQSSFI